jgi:hypothetical protein
MPEINSIPSSGAGDFYLSALRNRKPNSEGTTTSDTGAQDAAIQIVTNGASVERKSSTALKDAYGAKQKLPAPKGDSAGTSGQTDPATQKQIQELQTTDRKVRAHEQAHLAAGAGVVTGGPQYTYTIGPDGKTYATGGEVPIETTPEKTPEATIAKMDQVQRAALAPADPSPQDRRVAADAAAAAAKAQIELAREQTGTESPTPSTNEETQAQRNLAAAYQQQKGNFVDIKVY